MDEPFFPSLFVVYIRTTNKNIVKMLNLRLYENVVLIEYDDCSVLLVVT